MKGRCTLYCPVLPVLGCVVRRECPGGAGVASGGRGALVA